MNWSRKKARELLAHTSLNIQNTFSVLKLTFPNGLIFPEHEVEVSFDSFQLQSYCSTHRKKTLQVYFVKLLLDNITCEWCRCSNLYLLSS